MPGATRCYPPALPTNRISYFHAGSLSLVASPSVPLHSCSFLPPCSLCLSIVLAAACTHTSAFNLLFHRRRGPPLSTSVALSATVTPFHRCRPPDVFLASRGNEAALEPDEIRRENDAVGRLRSAAEVPEEIMGKAERRKSERKKGKRHKRSEA